MNPEKNTPSMAHSWLATLSFAFIGFYMHMSLSLSFFTVEALVFFIGGLAVCKVAIDIPGQYLQAHLFKRSLASKPNDQATAESKAAALATFVKAAQVIIAFVLAKFLHPMIF